MGLQVVMTSPAPCSILFLPSNCYREKDRIQRLEGHRKTGSEDFDFGPCWCFATILNHFKLRVTSGHQQEVHATATGDNWPVVGVPSLTLNRSMLSSTGNTNNDVKK